jgi:creatinine amidohydrolase
MTSVPPFIFYHMFLYQLRALYHAGFRAVFVLSGHGGSHPQDLRKIANYFKKHADMHIWFGTDFDLVAGKYPGDHAGKYEISTLMYLRPDLVDFSLRSLEKEESSGGMFALNESAMEASAAYGQQIMESCVVSLMELVQSLTPEDLAPREISMLRYEHMELIWQEIVDSDQVWATLQPRSGQPPVSEQSKWKPYEYARLNYLK